MSIIPGYKITAEVQAGINTVIYRGTRETDQVSVIIKTLKAEFPTLEEITRLRHEYKIIQSLDIEGVVKPYCLTNYKNGLALILEDFFGQSLKSFIPNHKFELIETLQIAISLASTLASLHQNQIIHKDINLQNIIINPATKQVKIIDFSIASRLSRENPTLSNPTLLEGTLAYMSPEQTGRMNRSIDYRTDLYSLGITFYEMLTGRVPFETTDPMELVHCHIAKIPVPPEQINPEIPLAVSEIVMKLLAKTAEERYQSGLGLKADLETCLTQLQTTGTIENFIPGQQDLFSQFLIPQKLYGRESEVAILMDAFERVSTGTSEMMLVSGYSGIGKSSLVNEVHKPIVQKRGYFIAGKFDQFKRNIPYASLIQAFQELIGQLLSEPTQKLAIWKKKLLAALGTNGQVIIDVIPEVELIVGQQPPVPQLGPTESQNRFNRVFKQFIYVFTDAKHPLVLFLDDLQWTDSASLKLIQLLMSDSDSQYLLLMGAYRDNEVSPTHPLIQTLDEIRKTGATVNNITLKPLDIGNVSQLVADTLHEPLTVETRNFASLLFNKTQGNPFFLTQLLITLHEEKLLSFDFSAGKWQWDIAQIQSIGITDYNVVELVARNIQKLSDQTQEVLKLAACIGDKFNLDVLAIVNEKSPSETAEDLWDALQAGLILPLSATYKIPLVLNPEEMGNGQDSSQAPIPNRQSPIFYKFLHDRVQQAAYSLIPEQEKKETHSKIGQLLLNNTPQSEIEDNIFEIVNQLNVGVEFVTDQVQKEQLAQLNLIAGRKAKAASAMEPALRYITVGLGLLTVSSWQSHYDLTLALHVEAVEVEYLNTNFDRAAALAEVVLQKATSLLDRVKAYELQIQFYTAQNQMQRAIDTGVQALELLGVILSNTSSDCIGIAQLPRLENIEDFPAMTSPYQLAALRILITVAAPAYIANPTIYQSLILAMVNLCIEHGHSALAAQAYTNYGSLLCGAGKLDSGYHSGQLALKLLELFEASELKSKVYAPFNASIRHWKEHTQETLASLVEGFQSGLETGDVEYAGYCAFNYCTHVFLIGEQLESVDQQQASYIDFLQSFKQDFIIFYLKIWHQLTLNLQGIATDKYRLVGNSFDEIVMLPLLREAKNDISLFAIYLAKLILSYLFKNYATAVENGSLAAEHEESARGLITVGQHNFYYSLALLALYPQAESAEQTQHMALVDANQEKMQHWASHAPCNYQHKYDLVQAEKARVLGQTIAAMDYYERAIQGAKEQGYIQEEALANELAAEFYFSRSREKLAIAYLTDAYYGYIRWGATAKVRDLEERYPQLLTMLSQRDNTGLLMAQPANYTTVMGAASLDLSTVIKASQAISSEIVFDQLLSKLMHILIENAGAEKGFLILERAGKLALVAEGSVDKANCLVLPDIPVETSQNVPRGMITYVERTHKSVVLNDAIREGMFTTEPYIISHQIKSLLCSPILHQGKLIGILYLENNITKSAFTPARLEVLRLLCGQAAISLELARAVKEVQDTVAYLSAIINNIADGLLVTDARGMTARVNPALAAMFHLSSSEIIGKDCQETFNTEIAQLIAQTLAYPSEVFTAEMGLASSRVGKAVATGISTEKTDTCIGSVTLIRDITAEKELDRMKTDFISTVSHELRTPLTSVLGFTRIIQKKLSEGIFPLLQDSDRKTQKTIQQVSENINIIVSEGERLTTLINDVLDIAKMEAGKVEWHMQATSITEIVERACTATSALFETKGLKLNKEIESGLPEVVCDRDRLLQVLINLISNAIKFTDTGFVTCRARLHQDEVVVSVIDTGIGIAPQDQDKVFEKFKQVGETLTDKPKGTGLGLPICKQIVEHHGGRVWVESQLDVGSTFSFTLPLSLNAAGGLKLDIDALVKQLKNHVVTATPACESGQKTILVVDDDAHIRTLLRQELETQGYEVREANDGMDAISQVKQIPPDLIILDVMMPQINGFDVAAVLKNDPSTCAIPIIVLSIIEDKQRGYRLGIDRYLTKPVNTEQLLSNIGVLLSEGTSKRKVLVVDEDASTVKILSEVLQTKGYTVMEASNSIECIEKAVAVKPDMIIVDSVFSQQHDLPRTLRFENGMENVLFLLLGTENLERKPLGLAEDQAAAPD